LIKDVYKNLKDTFWEKYKKNIIVGTLLIVIINNKYIKIFFKIIDMRWGISDSIANFSVEICVEEILRCNETSFGPSFVVYAIFKN
jgi:hypothetical protein